MPVSPGSFWLIRSKWYGSAWSRISVFVDNKGFFCELVAIAIDFLKIENYFLARSIFLQAVSYNSPVVEVVYTDTKNRHQKVIPGEGKWVTPIGPKNRHLSTLKSRAGFFLLLFTPIGILEHWRIKKNNFGQLVRSVDYIESMVLKMCIRDFSRYQNS